MFEREESYGEGAEGVVGRMSWTLHQGGSKEILESASFFETASRAMR